MSSNASFIYIRDENYEVEGIFSFKECMDTMARKGTKTMKRTKKLTTEHHQLNIEQRWRDIPCPLILHVKPWRRGSNWWTKKESARCRTVLQSSTIPPDGHKRRWAKREFLKHSATITNLTEWFIAVKILKTINSSFSCLLGTQIIVLYFII